MTNLTMNPKTQAGLEYDRKSGKLKLKGESLTNVGNAKQPRGQV